MSDNLIKPLQWKVSPSTGNDFAFSPSHRYAILKDDSGKFVVKKTRLADRHTDHCTGFKTFEAAEAFAENDHIEKLSAWLNPDPLTDYTNKFTQWSTDRKIIQNGNLQTQGLKLVSEIGELADNIAKGRDTKDDIGDCFVVLNNLVEMQGYTWQECLEQAWGDIKDRKGYMNKNGVFIKESDNESVKSVSTYKA